MGAGRGASDMTSSSTTDPQQALASLLTPRTTLLIVSAEIFSAHTQLNSPNNPTGQLISTSTLEEIIRLVREKAAPGCVIHW